MSGQFDYTVHIAGGGSEMPPKLIFEWPGFLRSLKRLAKEGDRGLGDIIERKLAPLGGTAFKVWFEETFGRDCGCGDRRDWLNARYPL